MPTYGYQCTQCKHQFQVFQSMKDDPLTDCPQCAGTVKRLLYPVGVVFKGSGWYINDSRKPDASEKADKAAETGDTKPAAETTPATTTTGADKKPEPATTPAT